MRHLQKDDFLWSGKMMYKEALRGFFPYMTVLWKLLNTFGWIFGGLDREDFVIKLQKYTSFANSWSTGEKCKNWDVVVTGGDKMWENSNLLQGLTFDSTTWWNEDVYSRSRTKNGCWPDSKWIKMLGAEVDSWSENAVKFKLKISYQIKKKTKQKRSRKERETKRKW